MVSGKHADSLAPAAGSTHCHGPRLPLHPSSPGQRWHRPKNRCPQVRPSSNLNMFLSSLWSVAVLCVALSHLIIFFCLPRVCTPSFVPPFSHPLSAECVWMQMRTFPNHAGEAAHNAERIPGGGLGCHQTSPCNLQGLTGLVSFHPQEMEDIEAVAEDSLLSISESESSEGRASGGPATPERCCTPPGSGRR